jgi:hypothetical protein
VVTSNYQTTKSPVAGHHIYPTSCLSLEQGGSTNPAHVRRGGRVIIRNMQEREPTGHATLSLYLYLSLTLSFTYTGHDRR